MTGFFFTEVFEQEAKVKPKISPSPWAEGSQLGHRGAAEENVRGDEAAGFYQWALRDFWEMSELESHLERLTHESVVKGKMIQLMRYAVIKARVVVFGLNSA